MCTLYKCVVAICFASLFVTGCKEKENGKAVNEQPVTHDTAARDTAAHEPHAVIEDNNLYADVDISPMDMSYFPAKYPQMKIADPNIAPPVMRVIYSRPHLQGRKLFEEILKYGQTWRLGANEATELNIFQPVTIGDKKIPVGRYTLYAIPKAGYWTIAINSSLDQWGLKQDPARDVVRVQVPVTYYNPPMEYFTMVFEKTDTGANLIMAWDDAVAKLPVKI
jgi:hypothetical protein